MENLMMNIFYSFCRICSCFVNQIQNRNYHSIHHEIPLFFNELVNLIICFKNNNLIYLLRQNAGKMKIVAILEIFLIFFLNFK